MSLDPIVKFRNICAHDERLYCARVRKREPIIDYAKMIDLVKPYLCQEDYDRFLVDVITTVFNYSRQSEIASHILNESGMNRLLKQADEAMGRQIPGWND